MQDVRAIGNKQDEPGLMRARNRLAAWRMHMFRGNCRVLGNDSGEIMIESLIVYSVTVILLFLILAVFSLLYQEWNVQTVANDAATRIAQVYRHDSADIDTGEVSLDSLVSVRPYRYIFGSEQLKQSAVTRVTNRARDRLRSTTFALEVEEPQITVEPERDALARRHLVVTVSGKYHVPGGEIFKFVGGEADVTFTSMAYAEIMDLSDYMVTVDFANDAASSLSKNSKTGKAADAVLKAVDNVLKLFGLIEE